MNTKLHALADANGRPLSFFMTAGQVSDYTGAAALLDDLPKAQWLLGDRGYDADWFPFLPFVGGDAFAPDCIAHQSVLRSSAKLACLWRRPESGAVLRGLHAGDLLSCSQMGLRDRVIGAQFITSLKRKNADCSWFCSGEAEHLALLSPTAWQLGAKQRRGGERRRLPPFNDGGGDFRRQA